MSTLIEGRTALESVTKYSQRVPRDQKRLGLTRGAKTIKQVRELVRSREGAKPFVDTRATGLIGLRIRSEQRANAKWREVIAERGGEAWIDEEHGREYVARVDRKDGLTLMRCDGWRYYSKRHGSRSASLAYLVGEDDNGPWAARVAGTSTTVDAALSFLIPQRVSIRLSWETSMPARGGWVKRQGDVYLIRVMKSAASVSLEMGSPTMWGRNHSHRYDPKDRSLTHFPESGRKHKKVRAPKSWPAVLVVEQRQLFFGRGSARD